MTIWTINSLERNRAKKIRFVDSKLIVGVKNTYKILVGILEGKRQRRVPNVGADGRR